MWILQLHRCQFNKCFLSTIHTTAVRRINVRYKHAYVHCIHPYAQCLYACIINIQITKNPGEKVSVNVESAVCRAYKEK